MRMEIRNSEQDVCPYCKQGAAFLQYGYSPTMRIQSVWIECPYCELRTIGYSTDSFDDDQSAVKRAMECFYGK